MDAPAETETDAWFFLALPDHDAAASIADRVLPRSTVAVDHPSGRPWLLGCLPSNQVVVHGDGPNRLALVGSTAVTPEQLGKLSNNARSVGDLTELSAQFAGNYCVIATLGGQIYAQGSALGVRRVFHALIDGMRVIADRADVLAELGGLSMDDTALALRLLPSLPHPLEEIPLWHGLHHVAPEDYVTVDRDGRGWNTGTWWQRPEPRLSRAEGARKLRAAVEAAVEARTAPGALISCDLSGGLDSTPVCYFAAQGPAGVLARTLYNDDPGGLEDLKWAHRALPSMPGVREHVVESTDDMPHFFGGLLDVRDRLDEPTQAAMAGPRISYGLRDDAARGIAIRLNGLGGDHLLRGMGCWEHTLFRSRPLLAWRRARAMHVAHGHGIGTTVRELLARDSYREWLRKAVTNALGGSATPELPRISDWSMPLGLPPWLSADARDVVAAKLRDVTRVAEPLGPDRAAHWELFTLRVAARLVRGTSQLGPRCGVVYDAPLLDDHVAETVLAVRREERDTPVEWKPLMKAAMRGLLPDEYLRRTTKTGGSAQAVRGFAAHHEDLRALCDSSGLASSGLIDMTKLAEQARPDPKTRPPHEINKAFNMAMFLCNQTRLGERRG
ncbi:asparagine synthase-related protein (plasmid) [Streptosporangium sp. CA-135522]|uniref:asparagine synthase-related protein n=1 Tax=Streptosporangium sp. CA-135522 TaxID=3240072 RepID=UPI003D8BE648